MTMKIHRSATILIPAYNEEKNIEQAVKKYKKACSEALDDYELLIFDDHSSDKTGEIADRLAKSSKKIRVVHNKKNMGIGYNYRQGVKLSKKEYYMMLPGEGEVYESSIKEIISHFGEADILITYIKNSEARQIHRRIISKGFTILLNILFGLHLKYYLGNVVHRARLLKKTRMTTNGSAYQAEILVRLLKKGHPYKEIPQYVEKTTGTSTFRVRNLFRVFLTVIILFFEVYIKRKF